MRTEKMQSFFGGAEMQPKQMDCTAKGQKKAGGAGFATKASEGNEAVSFREVMAENMAARRSTEKVLKSENSSEAQQTTPLQTEGTGSIRELAKMLNLNNVQEGQDDSEPQVRIIDDESAADAEQIVREAIADISELLGLTIFKDLNELSFKEVGSETQAQFAEIVFVLKKMVQGFEFSRANGLSIETPGVMVDGSNIDAVTDTLRTSTFKIEVACSVLGIAESVQKEVAFRLEMNGTAAGMVQATDPATLSMASQHTEQLFGTLFDETRQDTEVAILVQKIRALLAQGEKQPAEIVVNGAAGNSDLRQLDAQVYRTLLKIDAQKNVADENGGAASGNEQLHLPKAGKGVLPIADALAETAEKGGDESLSVLDVQLGTQRNPAGAVENRVTNALLKMTDETVMEQVTSKLQSVIRSGLTEVRVMLRPEALGEVQMRIRMEGDVVLARIEVQNQQVKEIMERNLPMLKDALAQQNLTAGSFDIQIGNGLGRHSDGTYQNPWEDGEMVRQEQYHQGKEKDDEQRASGENPSSGGETGRRFGSNSVEFFA